MERYGQKKTAAVKAKPYPEPHCLAKILHGLMCDWTEVSMAKGQWLNMSPPWFHKFLPLKTSGNNRWQLYNNTELSVLTFEHLLWPHGVCLYEVLTLSRLMTYIYIYIYMSYRTANLQMLHFFIYSTNIHTEYFKHAAHSPFFVFKMPFIS